MRKLERKEVEDIIYGATLLGAGGGGSKEPALKALDELFTKVEFIEMVEPDEVPDSAEAIVSAGMGSPVVLLERGWNAEQVYAFDVAEKVLGKKFEYVVPVETGGFNSFTPIQTAGLKNRKLVDGDGAGRAIPELEQTTFYLYGVDISPIVIADSKGNAAVLYPKDAYMGEEMGRAITTVFGMTAGIALYPMTGKKLKEVIVPGTLSLSEKVGKILREAKNMKKEDLIDAVLKATNGYLLGKGVVKKKTVEVKGSFDYGRVYVDDLIVDYKNENMIAWKGDKPIAMVPDSICWLGLDGTPLTNADIKEGMEVAVIGIKAHPKFRTKEAFQTFKHVLEMLGYKGDFIPIEDLVK